MDVKIDDLHIRQGDYALNADFEIKGGTTAIIGPSGGGKSTLLLAIAGFVELASGDISIGGEMVTHTQPAKRPVTLLFQENNLFPHMTVSQNTGLGIRPDLKLSKAQIEQVEDALEKVGLAGLGARRPSELSGGQRQRVALARALLRDRPVLMLDEPFAALGPALRHEMLDLVARIREEQDSTLLLVTHNPEDALRIAEQTVLVTDGIAMPPQPTAALLDNPPPALAEYLGK